MSSAVGGSSIRAKQRSVHRKKRPRAFGFTKKVSSEETSSPVAVLTATGKKLALPKLCAPSAECSVSSPAIDRACGSDSLCDMKGQRLIDLEELLASVTRRASCNVCGSGLTVRKPGYSKGCLYQADSVLYKYVVYRKRGCFFGPLCAFESVEYQVYSGREDVR